MQSNPATIQRLILITLMVMGIAFMGNIAEAQVQTPWGSNQNGKMTANGVGLNNGSLTLPGLFLPYQVLGRSSLND